MNANDLLIPVIAVIAVVALCGIAWWIKRTKSQRSTPRPPAWVPAMPTDYDTLIRAVRGELARQIASRVDWSRPREELRQSLLPLVGQLVDAANPLLNRMERAKLIEDVLAGIKPLGSAD